MVGRIVISPILIFCIKDNFGKGETLLTLGLRRQKEKYNLSGEWGPQEEKIRPKRQFALVRRERERKAWELVEGGDHKGESASNYK